MRWPNFDSTKMLGETQRTHEGNIPYGSVPYHGKFFFFSSLLISSFTRGRRYGSSPSYSIAILLFLSWHSLVEGVTLNGLLNKLWSLV